MDTALARAARIRIGLEGFTLPRLSAIELFALSADAGFDAVGVRLVDPATNLPVVSREEARMLRAQADCLGVELYGADLVDLEAPADRISDCLAVLADAGVTRLSCFHRGDDAQSARRRFRALVAEARAHDVDVFIEPVSYFGIRRVAQVAELIEDAGGLTLDTLHFARAADDLGVLAEIARRHPVWMQICDGPSLDSLVTADAGIADRTAALRHESVGERLLPGHGACEVSAIVGTVLQCSAGSDVVLMVEAPHARRVDAIGARAYADECLAAARSFTAALTKECT